MPQNNYRTPDPYKESANAVRNSIDPKRGCNAGISPPGWGLWVAQASRLVAMASRHRELSQRGRYFARVWLLPSKSSFRRDAKTNRRDACATRSPQNRVTIISTLLFCLALTASAGGESSPPKAHLPVEPYEAAAFSAAPTPLDTIVFKQLRQLGIRPANPCSDAVFIRRVYLDAIGTLPTADEVTAFLQDNMPNKRSLLIDKLLDRQEFADYWAMKSEFPINLWPNAVQTFHHWIRSCVRLNVPYDNFVRAMLTANGSNYSEPEVNFYRAVQSKEPSSLAQAVALTFMGVRTEKWPKERLNGMAAFFRQVGYKATGEWKEEIVFNDPAKSGTGTAVSAVFPDGTTARLSPDLDPREAFVNWLITPQNPWFTRNIANRVWSWLLGRGIINEPDDIRPDNPPSNPELLAYLASELIRSRYDLKQLFRLILNSNTYQLSSIPAGNDPRAAANFASYPVRRLDAEVLIDALNQITGATDDYTSQIPAPYTFIPEDLRAISLADASVTSPFLEMFGRSPRNTGLESERNNRSSATQELHMLNSRHIQGKLEQSAQLRQVIQQGGRPRDVLDKIYLTILSRYPTAGELKIIAGYAQATPAPSASPAQKPSATPTPPASPLPKLALNSSPATPSASPAQKPSATPTPPANPPLNSQPSTLNSSPATPRPDPTPKGTPAPPPAPNNGSKRKVYMDIAWTLVNSPEFLYRH